MDDDCPPTRVVAGAVVPAEGTWAIDPDHVYVGFHADRLAVASVRARFASVSGQVHIAADPADSSVEMVVDTASVESGSADRNERLRSTEHLDVARHPTATFRSTRTNWNGRQATVEGELTIVEVTNPVVFDVDYRGTVVDPWGVERSVFSARGVIDREDWGLTWNVTVEGGGLLVSRDVVVEVEVEAVRTGRHVEAASTSLGARC